MKRREPATESESETETEAVTEAATEQETETEGTDYEVSVLVLNGTQRPAWQATGRKSWRRQATPT